MEAKGNLLEDSGSFLKPSSAPVPRPHQTFFCGVFLRTPLHPQVVSALQIRHMNCGVGMLVGAASPGLCSMGKRILP